MKVLFYFGIILLFLSIIKAQPPYTHTYTPGSTNPVSHTHNFVGGGGKSVCSFVFTITPGGDKSYPVLMIVTNGPVSTSLSAYDHLSPTSSSIYDLENANKGQPQTVQIGGLNTGNTVTIKVVIFDTSSSFGWSISATEQNSISQCTFAGHTISGSPYCSNCVGLTGYGAYCNVNGITLSNNSISTTSIIAGGYVAFTIPGASGTMTVQYSSDTANVDMFVQFKTFSQEIAGWLNYVLSSGGSSDGYFTITIPTAVNVISINSGGSDVAIGVINQNSATINFSIQYTTQAQTINILVIVLGVLGGLLLIALIVAACFIIKRIRNPSQLIHPHSSSAIARQTLIQQNMLNGQEIQIYFPSVSCQLAFSDLETSTVHLSKEMQSVDRDCVICLCPVDGTDLMKVTYCRHLFHAHCLTQWFKKQRNCPYCREEYSKGSTIEHYQALLKETKRNILAGVELVQQILRTKISKSTLVIQELKD